MREPRSDRMLTSLHAGARGVEPARARRTFLQQSLATAALLASSASSGVRHARAANQGASEFDALMPDLRGELLLPSSDRFEATCTVSWNGLLPARRPTCIVVAESRADVVRALGFARARGVRVAVRSGGHNWCASALREGGMLLDLSRLRSIEIDPQRAIARVGPGATGGELAAQAAAAGLGFPVAHCPSVPLGGYLLNGGNGWNFNRWGSACSNVRAVELVLADGRTLTATPDAHVDLFWAARGAGPGFFAVITGYELALHPLPRAITTSSYIFPGTAITVAGGLLDDLPARLSREVELSLVLAAAPPELAPKSATVAIVSAVAFVDTPADGAQALAPLNEDARLGQALSSTINTPCDFDALFEMVARALPPGQRCLVDNVWSETDFATALAGTHECYAEAPSKQSHVLAVAFHPDFKVEGMALSLGTKSMLYNFTVWTQARDDAANRAWHGRATALFERYKVGRYVGETDLSKEVDVARQCFAPAAWARLTALRKHYDPNQLFFDYLARA